ncbi:hypothetical protein F5Y19DRAFT_474253 [Xylariaceae sp. FL1651]|nr:hypothetical protein F5Y19DRAFT_474253 [Xylariaceae sp. FL1651]
MRFQLATATACALMGVLAAAAPVVAPTEVDAVQNTVYKRGPEEVDAGQNTVYKRGPVSDEDVDAFINLRYKKLKRSEAQEVSAVQNTVYKREPTEVDAVQNTVYKRATDSEVDTFINLLY